MVAAPLPVEIALPALLAGGVAPFVAAMGQGRRASCQPRTLRVEHGNGGEARAGTQPDSASFSLEERLFWAW